MTPRANGLRRLFWPSLLGCLFSLLSACAGTSRNAPPALDAIADAVKDDMEDATARQLALAGFAAWIIDGKPAEAIALWDRALEREEDIVALYGRHEAARRALDAGSMADSALRICQRAPQSPLCVIGLRAISQILDQSPRLNATIERQGRALLESGAMRGEAALWLRDILAELDFRQGDIASGRATLQDAGVVDRVSLLGPFSTRPHLDWETAFAPEKGELGGKGPLGSVTPRDIEAPAGILAIPGEPATGHVYYWAADVTVGEASRHALIARGGSARVFIDGHLLLDRRAFDGFVTNASGVEVDLSAGVHRLLVKVPRLSDAREIKISLGRVDGQKSGVTLNPAKARATASPTAPGVFPLDGFWLSADALQKALEPTLGPLLARFAASRGSLHTADALGARELAESLCQDACPPALHALRGEARLADPSLSKSVAQGLALHDFETALKADAHDAPSLAALIRHAHRERRLDRVSDLLEQLRRAAHPQALIPFELDIALAQARGVDALVTQAAERALHVDPTHCASLRALFDLARKNDVPDRAAHLLEQMAGCQNSALFKVNFLRRRGALDEAHAALQPTLQLHPDELGLMNLAIDLDIERGELAAAKSRAEALCERWPSRASLFKKLADVLERMGEADAAQRAKERALEIDGSDLKLRQALAMKGERGLLQDALQDGQAWIARYLKSKPTEDAPAVLVLDSFVAHIHADGSLTGLTQTISRAIDQEGVSRLAEVEIPDGAEILVLRTIKEDGQILEPEPIPGKEALSMPGVEIGDFVEVAYLTSEAPPATIAPGFVTPRFYFRGPDDRFFHSTFEVRAPLDMPLIVDTHLIADDEIERAESDGVQRLKVARDDVPPLVREPNGPPLDELLPWMQIGSAVDGTGFLLGWADRLLLFDWRSPEIDAKARELVGDKVGIEALKALHAGVTRIVKGGENPFRSASATLSEERGSRVNLLKALAESIGFTARHVAVHGHPLSRLDARLPTPERWDNILLWVRLPDGESILLDPATRWAPFGHLPPGLRGAKAAKLPDLGEAIEFFTLPQDLAPEPHKLSLSLSLDADGALTGQGEDVFVGYQAAALRPALEKMGPERVRQMVEQSMVAAHFDGARLVKFELAMDESGEGPVVFRYSFSAPRFAQRDGEALELPNGLFTRKLAKTWLEFFSRETPLVLGTPSESVIQATLTLPVGFTWDKSPDETRLTTPFGHYLRRESVSGVNGAADARATIELEETIRIEMQRVEPDAYPGFGEFLTSVDRLQAQPWRLVPRTAPPTASDASTVTIPQP